jgi:predicted aspartyl protease
VTRLLAALIGLATAGPGPDGVTVPFAWTPGQIEVAVTVNGTPATFILDTGSEYSIVSTRLAQQLRLATEPRGARDFAGGVTLGIGPLALADQRVMVMPFETYYARGRQIDGLLGYDVFDRFAVRIDWSAKTLTFWERGAFMPPRAAVHIPIVFVGRLPVVAGTLRLADGRRLDARVMVDTGASQSIMLRHPFATAHGLFALATRETSAPSLANGTRRLVEVPADELTIGAWTFDRPQVLAFTDPTGSAGSTDTDGLIGNTLLSRFTLYVDYARKRLLFEPRPH